MHGWYTSKIKENSDKKTNILQETVNMLSLKIYLSSLCSCFLKIQTDGDFTTSLDWLFQASVTLLLKVLSKFNF